MRRTRKLSFSLSSFAGRCTLAVAVFALAGGALAALASADDSQAGHGQKPIECLAKPIITIDGLQFCDLNGNGKLDPYEDWRLPTEKRVADLLPRMTLEEKAGLMQITSFSTNPTTENNYINNLNIHYMILRDSPSAYDLAARANTWQEVAQATRLGIPLVFASNPRNHVTATQTFGFVATPGQFSWWPGTLGMAATNDLKLIRDFAEIARDEWRSAGIQKNYGYQVEVASEPRWYRIDTTFGESPDLNAAIARELVLGFQGEKLGPWSVSQTVKHFPGDGSVHNGLDPHHLYGQWLVYPTPGSLFKYQLPSFQAAVDAGANIMSCYGNPSNEMSAKQLPMKWWQSNTQQFEEVGIAYNRTFLADVLRDYMHFKGYVNTDSGVLTGMDYGVQNLTLPERFAKAVKAGVSIFSDNNDPSGLIAAVQQGLLDEADLNPSVALLLTQMFDLGLFEAPYTDPAKAEAIANSPASAARANEAHRKSIVLMRNDENLLPLTGTKKLYVAVFAGSGSATYTADLQALVATDPEVQVVYSPAQADAALVWLLPSVYQLPDNSAADIQLGPLTGIDVATVQQIETAVPTVLVINLNNPWVINGVEPGAAAVVATFDVFADALLDVVRGRFNPTGKLPLTVPADEAAVDNNASDVPGYAKGVDYVYVNRVHDKYIFGFGLSYGKHRYGEHRYGD